MTKYFLYITLVIFMAGCGSGFNTDSSYNYPDLGYSSEYQEILDYSNEFLNEGFTRGLILRECFKTKITDLPEGVLYSFNSPENTLLIDSYYWRQLIPSFKRDLIFKELNRVNNSSIY